MSAQKHVKIIGAGFSGLTLGYFLGKIGLKVQLFERSSRVGGVIASKKMPWGIAETAATGLLNTRLFEAVATDLGLTCAERGPDFSKRYVYRDGLSRWPLNILETASLLKGVTRAKLGLARPHGHESIKAWAERTMSPQVFEFLLGPALQGIYAEQELCAEPILSSLKKRSNFASPQKKGTVAPLGGMQDLTDALARKIKSFGGEIHLNAETEVDPAGPVVLAVPAKEAAVLLATKFSDLAGQLAPIDYLPVTTVTACFSKNEPHLKAFGCLFPRSQGFHSLGVLCNSTMFTNREAGEHVLETWIFSGVENESTLTHLLADRNRLLGSGAKSELRHSSIASWPSGIPHYNEALADFVAKHNCPPGVYLTGNYLGSIGLAKILENNYFLAKKISDET